MSRVSNVTDLFYSSFVLLWPCTLYDCVAAKGQITLYAMDYRDCLRRGQRYYAAN